MFQETLSYVALDEVDSGADMSALISSPFSRASHLRGLILDASDETRFVTRFFLNSLRVTTDEACSGHEGLRKLLANPFDFVILDGDTLSDMSGEDFLRSLASCELEDMPRIILLSAPTSEKHPEKKAASVAAILQKPFTVGSLEDVIWNLFPL